MAGRRKLCIGSDKQPARAPLLKRLCAARRLSPQGPVMQEEIATHAGVFVPTNVEAAWVLPDGSRWVYAQMTVSKVTASL